MNKLPVVHSVHTWLPQTETWLYNQVRFLPPEIESHVVCRHTENLDQFPCANLHSLGDVHPLRRGWNVCLRHLGVRRHLGYLVCVARQHNAQILHSHFGGLGWENLGASRKLTARHVVSFYGYDVHQLPRDDRRWQERYQELFSSADRVLCEGHHMAKCIVDLGCPEDKVQVHRLGVAVDDIPFVPRVWSPGEPLRILIAASFREKKGIPDALKALGALQKELDLEVTIIGNAGREPRFQAERKRILCTIEEEGLTSKVRLLGYQPYSRLLTETYLSHIFLAPSITASDGDTEGGAPVVLLEMAASGVPIVSTRHCDIPAVIEHGVTGLLADEGQVEELLGHLRRLAQEPESWREMVTRGREKVEAEFNAQTQGELLAGIYKKVLYGISSTEVRERELIR